MPINMASDNKVIPIYLFNLIVRVLRKQGAYSSSLIANTGLQLSDFNEQNTLVSYDQALQIINNAYRLSKQSDLGLRIAGVINISDWGMMGYAISSCGSLSEAMQVGLRYAKLATRLTNNTVHNNQQQVIFDSTPLYPAGALEVFLTEEDLGGIVNIVRQFLGSSVTPIAVNFRYPKPNYSASYQAHFCCPVNFDCKANQIIWSKAEVSNAKGTANSANSKLAIEQCETLLAKIANNSDICAQVKSVIVSKPGLYPPITHVAKQLNMGESSLRRALASAGSSYQDILQDIRSTLAIEYLTTSNLNLDQIADLVGYSDLSNFRRAFKKWTGVAPNEYRSKSSANR